MLFNSQPRRGCLEIREEGGEVFLSLLVLFFTIAMFLYHMSSVSYKYFFCLVLFIIWALWLILYNDLMITFDTHRMQGN